MPRAHLICRCFRWAAGSGRCLGLDLVFDLEVVHHSPDEPNHLACDSHDGNAWWTVGMDSMEELVESLLGLPGVGDDARRLSSLTLLQSPRHGRSSTSAPRGLDEHVSAVTVAGFGDRAPALAIARGVLARHESNIGHELPGTLEATEVTDLGDKHHRRMRLDPAEGAQPLDRGAVEGRERDLFDLAVEFGAL